MRLGGAVLVLAGLLLTAACGGPPPATGAPPPACPSGPGTPIHGVHDTSLPCLTGPGRPVHVSAVHGRPEVLNFWASWCGPCKQEVPLLERMHRLAGRSVLFLGVDVQDRETKALAFVEQAGATYPEVSDKLGGFPISLRFSGVPDTLVVDATGHIVFRRAGPVTEAQLRRALARAGAPLP